MKRKEHQSKTKISPCNKPEEMLSWPMTSTDAERPVVDVAFLSEDMTPADLYTVLAYLPWRRGQHRICIDHGVRAYLLDMLKEHLSTKQRAALAGTMQ